MIFRRKRDKDLDEELQSHLRMAAQDRMDRGELLADAEAAARRELGNTGLIKEVAMEVTGGAWFERLLQDMRYSIRVMRRNMGATVVSVLTLTLGIGASSAIFSVVYGVLLRPLAYEKPERIVRVWEVSPKGTQMQFADPNFEDLRAQNRSLQGLAEFDSGLVSVSGGAEPKRLNVAAVSEDFFSILRVQPVIGHGFSESDRRRGTSLSVLVSYAYWKQDLNGMKDFSPIKLVVAGQPASIVGVLPPGFRFPEDSDIWVPRETQERLPSRTAHNWRVIGRLEDGVSVESARADLSAIGRRLKQQYGHDITLVDINLSPLLESMTSQARPVLLILLGAVGFLLLVACANVMNLLLAQATAREGELAIRAALGASRGRMIRQFLTEALMLALLGGAFGVLAAYSSVNTLLAIAPADIPRLQEVSVQWPVLLFAFGLSVLVAAGLGVLTAWRATSAEVREALMEGGRAQAGPSASRRLGRAIIAAQIAMTLVLLVGAGLLGRSLLRVLAVDPGFRTEHIVTMDLALGGAEDDAVKQRHVQLIGELFDRLRALPGVQDVGGTSVLPLTTGLYGGTYLLLDSADKLPPMEDLMRMFQNPGRTGQADYCAASEGYFRALGIPLVKGRLFDDRDALNAPHAAVISESLAREKWPGQDPLGRVIEFGNMDGDIRPLTVVGVVGDVRGDALEQPSRPVIYVNYRQRPQKAWTFTVVVRTQQNPANLVSSARRIVRDLDPTVPPAFNTFTQVVATSLSTRRFTLVLVGIFAITALLLAVIGLYGVMAYLVERRTREIGVRMALGASAANVLRLVLKQAMATTLIGVALGMIASFVLTRTMRSLLFQISATDPLTYAGVALLFLAVALLAAYLPARRATQVDPMIALRHE